MKERNSKIEVLQTLGMLIIMCNHFGSGLLEMGGVVRYLSVDATLFIFIGGYLYNEKYNVNYKSIIFFIIKKVKRLLIPYVIWNLVYGVVAYELLKHTNFIIYPAYQFTIHDFLTSPFKLANGFNYNVASWFMIALFVVSAVYVMIRLIFNKVNIFKEIGILAVCFLISFIALKIGLQKHENLYLIGICRNLYLLFYFALGFYYKTCLEEYDNKADSVIIIGCIVTLLGILNAIIGDGCLVTFDMSLSAPMPEIFCFIKVVIGIYFWVEIAKLFSAKLGHNKYISYYSKHTFSLMMHQGFVGMLINRLYIFFTADESNLEYMHTHIWTNCFKGDSKVLLPISVSLVILSFVFIYDMLKSKIVNQINALL